MYDCTKKKNKYRLNLLMGIKNKSDKFTELRKTKVLRKTFDIQIFFNTTFNSVFLFETFPFIYVKRQCY